MGKEEARAEFFKIKTDLPYLEEMELVANRIGDKALIEMVSKPLGEARKRLDRLGVILGLWPSEEAEVVAELSTEVPENV